MNNNQLPPYPWQKNCNGQSGPRLQPLTYGPGPKYRNVPVPPPHNCGHNHPCDLPPPFIPPPGMPIPEGPRPPKPHHMNCHQHRQKYFYTVLFLDNYYEKPQPAPKKLYNKPKGGQLKTYDICADTETANVRWLDQNRLYVRHNLQLPITLEMWDHENRPIVYCPILKKDIDNVSLGDVQVDSERSIIINFCATQKPIYNQVFKLAIRSLPDFALTPHEHQICQKPLNELVHMPKPKRGLALIFRRNTLDGLYDLIAEFDQAYYHSLDQSSDLKYLTEKSCYKEVVFSTKYTNNLQDVLDLIDVNYYNVQYSWENHKKYLD